MTEPNANDDTNSDTSIEKGLREVDDELERVEKARSENTQKGTEHAFEEHEQYLEGVAKMLTHEKERSDREKVVKQATGEDIPGLLHGLLKKHDGAKRPALQELNSRLEKSGESSQVSIRTFYNWCDKYRLSDS